MKNDERVRITGKSSRGGVALSNVSSEQLEGVVNGCQWFGVTDGKSEFSPRYNPLPDPVEDEQLLPFAGNKGTSYKMIDFDGVGHGFPSITIQSLCGYNYTPNNYKHHAERLESYGFVCCRSRRGEDGKFWEFWHLPSNWAMRGALKVFYDSLPKDLMDKTKWERVISWLCNHSSFGTLDLCCQRAAMVMD